MILGYRDERTREFAEGTHVSAFENIRRQAEKRLDRLEAAPHLQALRGFPGNRLEALKGNRTGQYSIRINDQWRICFEWPEGALGPSEVEIVDYHS
jgi:proteic killer suppression protein